ncbi:hypothetical protein Tco_0554050 [Tanacetum coccineum]
MIDQGEEFEENEVLLHEDEISSYIYSTGCGQYLEDDDMSFYDGYEAQVYDLPDQMHSFCDQFDIRLNGCVRK